MSKYILNSEINIVNNITSELNKKLNISNLEILKDKLTNTIKNNKDSSVEDILNYLLDSLNIEMKSILDNNITLGIEYGIKNNYFLIEGYGGKLSINDNRNIKNNTLFSIDSISKILTSTITMQEIRNNKLKLNNTVQEYNNNFKLDATIESILKFTAYINTSKRIDYLTPSETLSILKECIENKTEKEKYKNYYQYNDIGIMILRQAIPDFLYKLNNLLLDIDLNNITYQNILNKEIITGGKIGTEYITPDPKGRGIPFPGHTGIYTNIEGLLNMFYKLLYTDILITNKEKEILWKQPYKDPHIYNQNNTYKIGINNTIEYTNKIAGIYQIPTGITEQYDKLLVGNIPTNTTNKARASAGTCGSWIMGDKLFNNYTIGILTNPYSFIENGYTPNNLNNNFNITNKGVIINYPRLLRKYKETLVNYAIILDMLTEYIKLSNKNIPPKKLTKAINT